MPQNFLSCDRDQVLLLPPDLRDWLPEDHLAWFVLAVVEAVLGDVIEWLKDEHEQELEDASAETTPIRLLGGPTGQSMSLVWALNDYKPADGGHPLMLRYAQRPDLDSSAREIVHGLAEARLEVYRVSATVPGVWVEVEPLTRAAPLRLPYQDWLERLHEGKILLACLVTATAMPTPWGLGARFAADSERRWRARLAALPADPAQAALAVLGFHPDDAAEPLPDGLKLYTMAWWVDDDDAVCETLEADDTWECLGQAIPSGWPSRGPMTRDPRLAISAVGGMATARSSLPDSSSVSAR
jgi:hypothetical protein